MLNDGFLDLLDNYSTAADGCDQVMTDSPSTIIGLSSASGVKQVVYDWGCRGDNPALQQLRDLDERIRTLADMDALLSLKPLSDCETEGAALRLASSYRLTNNWGAPVGVLRFTRDAETRRWIVETCGGHELSLGEVKVDDGCGARLVADDDVPKRWPGVSHEVSEIPVGPGSPMEPTSTVLVIPVGVSDQDIKQIAWVGSDCLGVVSGEEATP